MKAMKEKGSKTSLTPTSSSLGVTRFMCEKHDNIPINIFNFKTNEFICNECVNADKVDGASIVQVT